MNWTYDETLHKCVIYSGLPLSGSFKFSDIFQVSPGKSSWQKDKNGSLFGAEPILLEYDSKAYKDFITLNTHSSNNHLADVIERFRFLDFQKEILALLTLMGNSYFYINKSVHLSRKEFGEDILIPSFITCETDSLIVFDDDSIKKTVRAYGEKVNLPCASNVFLRQYFGLTKDVLQRFRMSLMLYYNSMGIREFSPSMSYVALISCIENLVDLEGTITGFKVERCSTCSQPQYKLTKRFTDFMMHYCGDQSPTFRKQLKKLYGLRSSIAHTGELLYMDYAATELDVKGNQDLDYLKLLVRLAIFNWILSASESETT